MMRVIAFMFFIVFSFNGYAGDFVCFDESGYITSKYMSKDCNAFVSKDNKCLKVNRKDFLSITEYSVVSDGEVREMTLEEKNKYDNDKKLKEQLDEIFNIENLNVSNLDLFNSFIKIINYRIPENEITLKEITDEIKNLKNLK